MKKPGRKAKLPVLKCEDLARVIRADGWFLVGCESTHEHYEHARKKSKVTLDTKWKNIKVGDWVFRSVVYDQAQMTKREFIHLYWKTR